MESTKIFEVTEWIGNENRVAQLFTTDKNEALSYAKSDYSEQFEGEGRGNGINCAEVIEYEFESELTAQQIIADKESIRNYCNDDNSIGSIYFK